MITAFIRRSLPLLWVFSFLSAAFAQPQLDESPLEEDQRLNLYVQCSGCDMNFIRQEIDYVNYVRDPADAKVHLMVTNQPNGAGGRTYQLDFIGKSAFTSLNHQLSFSSNSNDTPDEVRKGLARVMELGLVTYLAHTEWADKINVEIKSPSTSSQKLERVQNDPWNNWIFSVRTNGNINLESNTQSFNLFGEFSADQVTPEIRIRTRGYYRHYERKIKDDDQTYTSVRRYSGLNSSYVKSLSEHWSAGLFGGYYSNTYSNLKYSLYFHPAIEFNIFPYEEVTRREFTLAYRVGPSQRAYFQETIYDQTEELLWNQSLEVAFRLRQPWGSVILGLEGANYFHDFSKNKLEFDGDISLRVFKGLAVNMSSNIELVRDQLSLQKGEASLEDILLQQTQLATNYGAYFGLGISYSFGSLYNNIVNTRL